MELDKQDLGKVCLTMNGEFNPTISYEELCCVYVEDDSALRSFISIKPVPAGTDIYNREYWQPVCYGGGSPTPSQYYTLKIITIPSDATVIVNNVSSVGSISKNYPKGTIINWSVLKDGYITKSDNFVLNEDKTINVVLEEIVPDNFTYKVNPTPSDATVKINGIEQKQITVAAGTSINVKVSKRGYITQTFVRTITKETVENIQLLVDTYKLVVKANPPYAVIKIDGIVQSSKSFDFLNTSDNIIKGIIEVSKDGYDTVSQEYTITYGGIKETIVEISLGSNYINITPTILIFSSASTTPQNVIVDSSDSWTAK